MIPNSRLQDVDPETNVAGLGPAIRRALRPDLPVIGPDTEGLSPGFHKQSNGMLMYVPDMQALNSFKAGPLEGDPPTFDEPEGDSPEEAPPIDLQVDATRPVGFYEIENGGVWVKRWTGACWSEGYCPSVFGGKRVIEILRHLVDNPLRGMIPRRVLHARLDLDAMVLQ